MSVNVKSLLDELIGINFDDDATLGRIIGQTDGGELTEYQAATLEEVRSCLQATLKTLRVAKVAFEV